MDILIACICLFAFLFAFAWAYNAGIESVIDKALMDADVEAYGEKWEVSAKRRSV